MEGKHCTGDRHVEFQPAKPRRGTRWRTLVPLRYFQPGSESGDSDFEYIYRFESGLFFLLNTHVNAMMIAAAATKISAHTNEK